MDPETKQYIDDQIKTVLILGTKKYGDTPTDANQLTPKKYVNSFVSIFAATSIISGGIPAGNQNDIQYNGVGSVFAGDDNLQWIPDPGDGSNNYIDIGMTPNSNPDQLRIGAIQGKPTIGFAQGTRGMVIGPFTSVAAASSYTPGKVFINGADGDATTGGGGDIILAAGASNASIQAQGAFIQAQGGSGNGTGGNVNLIPGDISSNNAVASVLAGDVLLSPGSGKSVGKNGRVLIALPGQGGTQTTASRFSAVRVFGELRTTNNSYINSNDVDKVDVGTAGFVHARVVGRRTGGSAGTANDCLIAEMMQGVKQTALVGSLVFTFFYGDNANADAKFGVDAGNNVVLQLRGDTNNNYLWHYEFWYTRVDS